VSLAQVQAIANSVHDPRLFVEPLAQSAVQAHRQQQARLEHVCEAIRNNRFEIYAQRIQGSDQSSQTVSFEILVRLIDRDGSLITPNHFLSLAAQAHMIPALDRGVISRVFSWLSRHPAANAQTEKCSINLSGQTLSDGLIADYIREERQRYGIDPSKIVFEITESEAISNPAAATRLVGELKSAGFGIALDDFGVGLATFEYLKRFSPDWLKIDGSFIRNIAYDPVDQEIVGATVRVARQLGIRTVAEHVQSRQIQDQLVRMGVEYFQGELHGPVVPLSQMFDKVLQTG
jgi:EAL domain-containing protein (putative c-di-GMP-specific phosphodiesterase class I)